MNPSADASGPAQAAATHGGRPGVVWQRLRKTPVRSVVLAYIIYIGVCLVAEATGRYLCAVPPRRSVEAIADSSERAAAEQHSRAAHARLSSWIPYRLYERGTLVLAILVPLAVTAVAAKPLRKRVRSVPWFREEVLILAIVLVLGVSFVAMWLAPLAADRLLDAI